MQKRSLLEVQNQRSEDEKPIFATFVFFIFSRVVLDDVKLSCMYSSSMAWVLSSDTCTCEVPEVLVISPSRAKYRPLSIHVRQFPIGAGGQKVGVTRSKGRRGARPNGERPCAAAFLFIFAFVPQYKPCDDHQVG